MTNTYKVDAENLRQRLRLLDDLAALTAAQYRLWSDLLPRAAYPPGKLTTAVIEALEGRAKDATRA